MPETFSSLAFTLECLVTSSHLSFVQFSEKAKNTSGTVRQLLNNTIFRNVVCYLYFTIYLYL